MDHIKALAIKFIIISIVLYSILGIFNNASITTIFIISVLVTGVSYLLGDLFILRRYGNLVASIADFGLVFLFVWALATFFFQVEYGIFYASLFSALLIACSEAVFHMYMHYQVFHKDEEIIVNRRNINSTLQTEFSEEYIDHDFIDSEKDKDDNK
ncbi:YndM family protein [Aquibacillus saliphilus]|uniref:YndM family protein n=1 Tax=Aquibacillus saliphilus TaxID=1909422 RepID=UPI001CF0BE15|nr:YndM family protein [Aquibacillus saliphilus]